MRSFWESAILAFKSAILAFKSAITLVVESAITLIVESAIILGESIFREWRSFFVMTRGDLCLGCEVRSLWESAIAVTLLIHV